ncbi:MAG: hypothetical protein IKZ61_00895 [Prevotella sp.]|nr:hypothetical protein [Prevotella sp.]
MSKAYYTTYIKTHDIDWFCQIGARAIHCASNGGKLPEKVNDRAQNRRIQEIVANMEDIFVSKEDIAINDDYVYARLGRNESPDAYERYIESFVAMAKKGFISFDRMIDNEHSDNSYIWIAKPKREVNVRLENLPRYEESTCPTFRRWGEVIHVECLDRMNR